MDLTKVFSAIPINFGKKKEEIEHFLAIKISLNSVYATCWYVEDGNVKTGKVGNEKLAANDFPELLRAVDKAVSLASEGFPDITKAIFSVPAEKVKEGKIVPDELVNLRKLCKELDLFPLGYVVAAEALEEYFKETEGAPLSAILVGLDGKEIALAILKAGKIVEAFTFPRGEDSGFSIPAEIEKALKGLGHAEALPSRIIVYDGDRDLTALINDLTAYPWTGKLPFLHFPKVEKVTSEQVVIAVATAGGMQMGGKLALVSEIAKEEEARAPQIREQEAELVEVAASEAGFTTEGELEMETLASPPPITPPDISQIEAHKETPTKRAGFELEASLAKLPKLPRIKLGGSLWKFGIIGLSIFLLVGGIIAGLMLIVPKVRVIAVVKSEEFNKEMEVKVTTDPSSALEADTIAGTFVEASEIGTKRSVATGQKLVGKKASGQVTIYSVTEGKNFPEGTSITSPSGLKFTLDKDVSVASGDAVSAATVTAPIEASSIGDSFNLAAGTRFTVGSFSASDYLAKNESALTGGESHMATVVTKADQDRLSATLAGELTKKAKEDLAAQIKEDQTLLPNAITSTVAKKKFSKDIDSEADTVSLDLTMDFKGVVFSKDEAIKLFSEKFKTEIPENIS